MDLSICGFTYPLFDRLYLIFDQQSALLNCFTNDNNKWFCFGKSCDQKQKTYSDYNLNNLLSAVEQDGSNSSESNTQIEKNASMFNII